MEKFIKNKKVLLVLILLIAFFIMGGLLIHNKLKPTHGYFVKIGDLNYSRSRHTATLLPDERVVIIGGGADQTLSSIEMFEPAKNKFRDAGSLNYPRVAHNAILLNDGKILVFGGEQLIANKYGLGSKVVSVAEIYDPVKEESKVLKELQSESRTPTITKYNDDEVLVVESWMKKAFKFNLKTRKKTELKNNYEHREPKSFLLKDGRVLVLSMFSNSKTFYNFEIFNPKTNKFIPLDKLVNNSLTGNKVIGSINDSKNLPMLRSTAILLKNGKVLLTGGNDLSSSSPLVILDVDKQLFQRLPCSINRYDHSLVLLNDGKVLITGGIGFFGGGWLPGFSRDWLKTAEVFDPKTNTIQSVKDMNDYRVSHQSTLLKNGTVLITGTGSTSKTSEIFIP
jgi:hypothetical protein